MQKFFRLSQTLLRASSPSSFGARTRFALAAVGLLWGVAWFGTDASAEGKTSSATSLRVLSLPTEPFLYLGENGEPVGLEYDLLTAFAEAQGRTLEIVWAEGFPDLFPRLEKGDVDLISAALTITPSRLERFDFSAPYFPVLALVIEKRGRESTNLQELKGKKILLVPGTSHDDALRQIDGVELLYGKNDAAIFPRLAAGEADGLATDSPAYFWYAEKYPQFGPSFSFGERSYYGFAVRPGDPLKKKLDVFLESAKRDGSFRNFLHDAFGEWGAEAIDEMADGMFDAAP